MKNVLFLDSMLTTKIITLVYWLFLLIAVVSGLGKMFGGFGGMTFGNFLWGLVYIVGGAIAARIFCEMLIVLFKIHENIKRLADREG